MLGKELITNGDFADWTTDNPDGWNVIGEVGDDPEVSEAATGESHADTPTLGGGMCNIYRATGAISLYRSITTVIGRKYRMSVILDTRTAGAIWFAAYETDFTLIKRDYKEATGELTFVFTAVETTTIIQISNRGTTDVTFDDVSVREDIPTGLSRTGQHFSSFQY